MMENEGGPIITRLSAPDHQVRIIAEKVDGVNYSAGKLINDDSFSVKV